jgi:hypothetical protein
MCWRVHNDYLYKKVTNLPGNPKRDIRGGGMGMITTQFVKDGLWSCRDAERRQA